MSDGAAITGGTNAALDMASVPAGHHVCRDDAVRISRYERTAAGSVPETLGDSIATSNAIPFELDEAMKRYAAKQAADEDEDEAIVPIITLGFVV